jgi:hypothetical protein
MLNYANFLTLIVSICFVTYRRIEHNNARKRRKLSQKATDAKELEIEIGNLLHTVD